MYDEPWLDDDRPRRRPGLLFGVCRWLADRLGLAAFWVRLAVLVAAILLGQARPGWLPSGADWRLPRGFTSRDVADLRSRCSRLERRCREVESRLRWNGGWGA